MGFTDNINNAWRAIWGFGPEVKPVVIESQRMAPSSKPPLARLPNHRISKANYVGQNIYELTVDNIKLLRPEYQFEVIPFIRQLILTNPNFGQALNNIVALGNTGFRLKFHPDENPDNVEKMREHMETAYERWGKYYGGIHGVVNRMISQLLIGGATSTEWVPSKKLDSIRRIAFIKPETIRFSYDESGDDYSIYQKLRYWIPTNTEKPIYNYVKLNTNTVKYVPLNGDDDLPYGYPPYLTALEARDTQAVMLDNIKFVSQQVGIMGYQTAYLDKPDKTESENEEQYLGRLNSTLQEAAEAVQRGFRNGVNVAYKDDVEFEFNATSTNASGVGEIFQENELQFMSGLKQDAALMGRGYATSETQITVVFTKMLAELKNTQNPVKENLKFGIGLELQLSGFQFKPFEVEFYPSTLNDELKMQQGLEYKIRNAWAKYNAGITSMQQFAEELGYIKPDQDEPRLQEDDRGNAAATGGAGQPTGAGSGGDKKRQGQKNKSAKTTRDKKKAMIENVLKYLMEDEE